jgi:hypothetical protein
VAEPCAWTGNIKIGGSQPLRTPAYIENVYELLGTEESGPGDFYIDAGASLVYYVPHADEAPDKTVGELPLLDRLIDSEGASDIKFEGINFQHTTWCVFTDDWLQCNPNCHATHSVFACRMGPSTPLGFVDIQAGYTLVCQQGDYCSSGSANLPGEARETPSSLQFRAASNVSFSRCSFGRMGSNAVGFSHGSHNNSVRFCHFDDLSASAVAIGTRDVSQVELRC